MLKTNLAWSLSIALVAAALAAAPAGAKSSGSSHSSPSHSSASHSSSSHSSSSGRTHSASTRKPLPAGTHFVSKTCKTSSCRAKHPGGSYMLPIKPKKGRPA